LPLQPLDFLTMAQPSSGLISDDDDLKRSIQADAMQLESNSTPPPQNPASKIQEWTLLVRIVTSGTNSAVNVVKIHKDIFALLQAADDKFVLKTLQGSLIESTADFPSGADYQSHFKTKETKTQFVVSHTVYSSKTIDAIKRTSPALLDLLRANNVFLDLSVTGSLFDVVLGPIFGIHPDHTSKKQLQADIEKLLLVHKQWKDPLPKLLAEAKENLDFEDFFPPFQLRTRRIRREINGDEFSAKATVFVCASEHRALYEHLLVEGMSEGWFKPVGRFYLLLREDKSNALKSAICYHNRMISSMKAVVITGITNYAMDCGVRPPHSAEERPTLREHIHNGGFISLISSHEPDKWIGITTDVEAAKQFVNTSIRDLCAEVYDDGTAPVATTPTRPPRQDRTDRSHRSVTSRQSQASRSALIAKQGTSWADIARDTDAENNTLHSESNIARRPPRTQTFQSRVRFDIEVINLTDEQPKNNAPDSETAMTAITQDYLDDMESRLTARFQDELGSRLSDLSSPHDNQSRHDALQTKLNLQISQQNEQIQLTMNNMHAMMCAMQQLVQNVASRRSSSSSSGNISFQDANEAEPLPYQEEPHSPSREFSEYSTQEERPDYASASQANEEPLPTSSAKRSAPTQKGESPAAKRQPVHSPDRGEGGRGDAAMGRGRRHRQKSLRKKLDNRYGPLETTSDAQSSSGSI
jgi:hypothetical protein